MFWDDKEFLDKQAQAARERSIRDFEKWQNDIATAKQRLTQFNETTLKRSYEILNLTNYDKMFLAGLKIKLT